MLFLRLWSHKSFLLAPISAATARYLTFLSASHYNTINLPRDFCSPILFLRGAGQGDKLDIVPGGAGRRA